MSGDISHHYETLYRNSWVDKVFIVVFTIIFGGVLFKAYTMFGEAVYAFAIAYIWARYAFGIVSPQEIGKRFDVLIWKMKEDYYD